MKQETEEKTAWGGWSWILIPEQIVDNGLAESAVTSAVPFQTIARCECVDRSPSCNFAYLFHGGCVQVGHHCSHGLDIVIHEMNLKCQNLPGPKVKDSLLAKLKENVCCPKFLIYLGQKKKKSCADFLWALELPKRSRLFNPMYAYNLGKNAGRTIDWFRWKSDTTLERNLGWVHNTNPIVENLAKTASTIRDWSSH